MEYNFREREKFWQQYWASNKTFKAENQSEKPKFYVLDMFPYPSGAGLHVGHPLGYIASDIVSRYKRQKGFNVLHPMGYDSFGLPAEQYAIQTGQHPAITTEQNIARYRQQLDNIGFSFDWNREVRTSNPEYYKWTQWIFMQIFNAWYNKKTDKAEHINSLIQEFEQAGNTNVHAVCDESPTFTAAEWNAKSDEEKQRILLHYRLTYLADTWVNWCPQLGTVLANEEVKDGVSERGGYPVERKLMKQWSMRITAYAERLLQGLNTIDWSESIKESQRNWIGKSEGSSLEFKLQHSDEKIEVFTTRPDTIFGVSFLTLAPEHELVSVITTEENKKAVDEYVTYAKNRSERDRMSDVKKITGQFTGAYAVHPFTNTLIPIWIGDYVLAGYGTGAVMAVPAGDQRDYDFAKHFNLPILPIVKDADISEKADDSKEGIMVNSDFLNGLTAYEAMKVAIAEIEKKGIGNGKINYRLRDAIFSRQRYWGEPIPVYFKNELPYLIEEKDLPLVLPEVDKYLPTETGEPPLARAEFKYNGYELEKSTMPGWAGSSWYFFRYMDAQNQGAFASKEATNYWNQVDLYLGGSEHATGHLLYCRFWTKFLYDLGFLNFDEPAKKLINQGMIQGRSNFVYRINGTQQFVSKNLKSNYDVSELHVDVNIVDNDVLDLEKFRNWRDEFKNAEFILEDGKYLCGAEVEKMSKSKWNVVNPDDIVEKFGADCLRLYEMFLGPLELSKPWNTNGITGVAGFIKKFWRLFTINGNFEVSTEAANKQELKVLHKTIRKVEEDIERFSFNTSVSTFMICVNELSDLKCNKREILEPLTILLSSYAPHIAEEVWSKLGHTESITYASFPLFDEKHLVESSFEYPVSINGKTKFKREYDLGLEGKQIEELIVVDEEMQKYLNGAAPKKIIVVKGKIINVVL
jgi:leucyl-tRNA synthetase